MIVQILQRTPIWVWPLFAALLYLGYVQSKTRSVSKQRLFALPLALVGLSLYSLFTTFGATRLGFAYGFLSCTFPARAHALVRAARHAPKTLAGQGA